MATDTGTWLAQQLMRDFGLSPAAASGFAGNLAHESGNFKTLQEINPTVAGSRGGYGWAQWTGPRRRQFEAWSQKNGLDPSSPEANYGFLKYELTNTPEKGVLARLQGVKDPSQAARVVSDTFLRPGVPHMDSRINRSNQIAGALGSPPQEPAMADGPKGQEAYPQAAPPLSAPRTIADAPIGTPQPTQAPQPQQSAPQGLLAMLTGGGEAQGAANPLLSMLAAAQPQQAPQMLQPPQAPQQPSLADYITQFMQARTA